MYLDVVLSTLIYNVVFSENSKYKLLFLKYEDFELISRIIFEN